MNPIACDGHGLCAELFPERVTLDDWGYPIVDGAPIPRAARAARAAGRRRVPRARAAARTAHAPRLTPSGDGADTRLRVGPDDKRGSGLQAFGMQVNVWTVTAAAAVTCLATGLGSLPFLFARKGMARHWLGISNAIASGFMLAASVGLLWQGWTLGVGRLGLGALLGAICIYGFRRLLGDSEDIVLGRLTGADARKAFVVIAVMTAHSASEGVESAFSCGGEKLGLLITLAIAIHDVPEGLAISLVLVPRGATVRSAAGWSVFSELFRSR